MLNPFICHEHTLPTIDRGLFEHRSEFVFLGGQIPSNKKYCMCQSQIATSGISFSIFSVYIYGDLFNLNSLKNIFFPEYTDNIQ